jgi:hypothetical protein
MAISITIGHRHAALNIVAPAHPARDEKSRDIAMQKSSTSSARVVRISCPGTGHRDRRAGGSPRLALCWVLIGTG